MQVLRVWLPPRAIWVTVPGATIADPCAGGKPLVQDSARRTKRAAEKNRHGAEGRTVNVHAGGNGFPRLGAVNHDSAHSAVPKRFRVSGEAVADRVFAALLGHGRICRL